MKKEMPYIRASALTIACQGSMANPVKSQNFDNLLQFIEDYIATRINHIDITDGKISELANLTGRVKGAFSLAALGFSPI